MFISIILTRNCDSRDTLGSHGVIPWHTDADQAGIDKRPWHAQLNNSCAAALHSLRAAGRGGTAGDVNGVSGPCEYFVSNQSFR